MSDDVRQPAIMTGNPIDGVFLYGPFASNDEATEFAEREQDGQDWWTASIRPPIETDIDGSELIGYTVVVLNLDGNAAFVEHTHAKNPQDAYLKVLEEIEREGLGEDEPLDLEQAARDRPLLAVFVGHSADVSGEAYESTLLEPSLQISAVVPQGDDVPVMPGSNLLDGWSLWKDDDGDWWLRQPFLTILVSAVGESQLLGRYPLEDARIEAIRVIREEIYACASSDQDWASEDQDRALRDGWGVFDHSERGIEIERVDDPSSIEDGSELEPRFEGDEAAGMYVETMAAAGYALHRKAVAYVAANRTRSPEELAEAAYLALDLGQALREGWCIDQRPGAEGGAYQLVQVDSPEDHDPPLPQHDFDGDADAQRHVVERAIAGSAYHLAAIRFLMRHNPQEIALIREDVREVDAAVRVVYETIAKAAGWTISVVNDNAFVDGDGNYHSEIGTSDGWEALCKAEGLDLDA